MTFLLMVQALCVAAFIVLSAVLLKIFRTKRGPSKVPLRKETALRATVKDGRWLCPSCNDTNLEIKDDCGSCGQKVTKSKQ
ncbi:MAG: hypothetical protein PHQ96_05150 [Candidatus Omnitrophica bacterium]|nr:hypothetical protein [Candidatus Omnitrophota bacterium]